MKLRESASRSDMGVAVADAFAKRPGVGLNAPRLLTIVAVLVAVLVSAQPSPQVPDSFAVPPRSVRSYFAAATFTNGSPPSVVVLDPGVQAQNGLVITDVVVHPLGGPFWYMVEIRENGTAKASLGEAVSPNWNSIAGSPSMSLRSGIPIQKNASLEIGVSGGTYVPTSPQAVQCTISGYVW